MGWSKTIILLSVRRSAVEVLLVDTARSNRLIETDVEGRVEVLLVDTARSNVPRNW